MATIQNITIDQDADYTETLTVKDSDWGCCRFNWTNSNK